jgi:ectoine hydroxylase-related dioxygenase (phytanoyl-CoA dioxygenase family)
VDVIPLPAPGEVLLFSGAQLHTSIPNTSGLARYSVDFRTVNTMDLHAGLGAPLVDAACTGTAIRDFVSTKDESAFDEEAVRSIYGAPPTDALLVFGGSSGKR